MFAKIDIRENGRLEIRMEIIRRIANRISIRIKIEGKYEFYIKAPSKRERKQDIY